MFKRFWWVFLAMIPVGSIAGLFAAAVITYVMPKKYESEAVIELKPRIVESERVPMTPQFFGTEFEKIKSRNSLGKVVDQLELINKWGVDKETAIRILKDVVTTQNIRGTDLISIRVRHVNKEDARDIAAGVARAYSEYRMEIEKRGEGHELLELRKSVREQEEKVEERRKVLVTITRTGSFLGGADMTEEDVKKAMDGLRAQDVIDAKRALETDQALLQSMKLKLINDDITAKLQGDSIVIHEEPQISQAPVSPNVTLNLVFGTVLGFLLSPLLSLPVIYLLHRLIPAKAIH